MSRKGDAVERLAIDVHGLPVDEPWREYRFHPERKWRFDFAWPIHKVAVEVDGGTWRGISRHTTGTGFRDDCRKLNAAAALGWRVLRFTSDMVLEGEAYSVLAEVFSGEQG